MSRRRLLLIDFLAMLTAGELIIARVDTGWVQVAAWLVLICGFSLFVGLILGGIVDQRERQYPRIPDDGQDVDGLARAVGEVRDMRLSDAQFALWEQELRERERES
jgi:hypothetical protein